MKPEIETTIRAVAQTDGIPSEQIEAGLAEMKRTVPAMPPDDSFNTLAEMAQIVRKHSTWLWRLKLRENCGERLGGRFMYRKSRVIAYLQSATCQARIRELHEIRKTRELNRKQGA